MAQQQRQARQTAVQSLASAVCYGLSVFVGAIGLFYFADSLSVLTDDVTGIEAIGVLAGFIISTTFFSLATLLLVAGYILSQY